MCRQWWGLVFIYLMLYIWCGEMNGYVVLKLMFSLPSVMRPVRRHEEMGGMALNKTMSSFYTPPRIIKVE